MVSWIVGRNTSLCLCSANAVPKSIVFQAICSKWLKLVVSKFLDVILFVLDYPITYLFYHLIAHVWNNTSSNYKENVVFDEDANGVTVLCFNHQKPLGVHVFLKDVSCQRRSSNISVIDTLSIKVGIDGKKLRSITKLRCSV